VRFGIYWAIKYLFESDHELVPLLAQERRNESDFLLEHDKKQFKLVSEAYVDDLMIFIRNRHLNFVDGTLFRIKHANIKSHRIFGLYKFSDVSDMVCLTFQTELWLQQNRFLSFKHILKILFCGLKQHFFYVYFLIATTVNSCIWLNFFVFVFFEILDKEIIKK